jgi:chromosome segregation ATPase
MALSTRMLGRLGAAPGEAFEQLQQEVARLAQQLAESRSDVAGLEARLREEVAQARSETEGLRQELRALSERIDEHAHQDLARVADLEALQKRCEEREGATEDLRLKIAGLAEQSRWESEDLRKALAAIAEWTRQPA